MKRISCIVLAAFVCFNAANAATPEKGMRKVIDKALDFSVEQSMLMYEEIERLPGKLPRSIKDGKLLTSGPGWWTSGFFPGTLWYLYEYSQDEKVLEAAEKMSDRIAAMQFVKTNHDVGFQINCSFGNGYRLTGKEEYRQALINAGNSLATRFLPSVGCTRSWGGGHFLVIIDNMMNLELLTVSSALTGDPVHYNMAVSHADKTMECHFRPDASSFHVVDYDPETGKVLERKTRQGAADNSAWSRGQAWAVYGYTMMYRQTKDRKYLELAERVADFIIHHPRMPKDMIPYWDFDAPGIPDTPRDASAAAVMASAFIELSTYTEGKTSGLLLKTAAKQLRSLASAAYTPALGENCNFLLMHSTGFFDNNVEVDQPLTYADYYYVEALLRYKRLLDGKPVVDDLCTLSSSNEDRAAWISVLTHIADPVLRNLSQGTLKKNMPVEALPEAVEKRRQFTHLEALGRVLTGIAPWLELGPDETTEGRLRERYIRLTLESLKNAVDPQSEDYMQFNTGRQGLVDAAFLAHGLLRAKTQLWGRLDEVTRERLVEELESTRGIKPNESNWLLFSAIVECALKEFTGEWNPEPVRYALDRHESWYKGDGWYGDGKNFHLDYYNSYVIQPMLVESLSYVVQEDERYLDMKEKQEARYSQFAGHLESLISPEATYPVLGRSSAYRFGAFHALSDAAYRHMLPERLTPGQVRNAMTEVILRQAGMPGTFDSNGWLTLGFCGHQPSIADYYVSTGSLYLCTAAFIALGLGPEDEFWTAPDGDWTQKKIWNGIDTANH